MGLFDKLYIDCDFEFCQSQERVLTLTSCSFQVEGGSVRHTWLYKRKDRQERLKNYFYSFRKTHIIRAYGAVAECRSFQALGLIPADFKWIDLFFEHRQLTHNYKKFAYGTYFTESGLKRYSVAPKFSKTRNKNKDNNPIGLGYVDAVASHFETFIDSKHKKKMRDLILQNKGTYTKDEQQAIMDYCDSDIKWLPKLHESMSNGLAPTLGSHAKNIPEYQLTRGEYAVSVADMEKEGYPIRVDWVINLRRNFEKAKDTLISELNKKYPFYIRQKDRKRDLVGGWVFKYSQFAAFIDSCDEIKDFKNAPGYTAALPSKKAWPLSDKTRKYKTDGKSLELFDNIEELYALRQCNKLLGQLKWFQIPSNPKDDFFNNVGSDGRLRAYLGAYGTQTGRNAPKAKQFVLAMSAWLRCLIQPKEGEAIVGIDWASQEFIIAASLSGDKDMIKAYDSGDPYLYFAKKAGAVSLVDAKWWMQGKADFDEAERNGKEYVCSDLKKYKVIAIIRNLFKATTLGLQYGMGAESLAIKLTADTGKVVTVKQAKKLIKLHKKTYPTYWKWLDTISGSYEDNDFLLLRDGWALLPNNDNMLSVRNFPVQGTGAVIMREACKLYQKEGGRICSPLHDAIYGIYDVKTESHHPELLGKCMQKAVENILGEGIIVRQDKDIHDHKHVWMESKGEKYYKLLSKYLGQMATEEDIQDRVHKKIYNLVA